MPECFPDPNRFDPSRYEAGRDEDRQLFAWIPFGAGRHRCVGSAFAMMQLKAIFSDLLMNFEFELSQPPASYHNDHSRMVVQIAKPCRVRYRRRKPAESGISVLKSSPSNNVDVPRGTFRVCVDLDLCQGHAVCADEAPEVFEIDREENKVVLRTRNPNASHRERVEKAVRHCPTRALSIGDPEPVLGNQE
jgi:sterol 14-demethylase